MCRRVIGVGALFGCLLGGLGACSADEANEAHLLLAQIDRYSNLADATIEERGAFLRDLRAFQAGSTRIRTVRDLCAEAYEQVYRAEQSLGAARVLFEPYRAKQQPPPLERELQIQAEIDRVEGSIERARGKIRRCQTELQRLRTKYPQRFPRR